MANTGIRIIGLTGLQRGLSGFRSDWRSKANQAIKKSIFDLEAATKPVTPIDTGRLRSSFIQSFGELKGTLQNYAPYAIFVHEGTSRWPLGQSPKNPHTVRQFFVRGFKDSEKQINDNFEKALDKSVRVIASRI